MTGLARKPSVAPQDTTPAAARPSRQCRCAGFNLKQTLLAALQVLAGDHPPCPPALALLADVYAAQAHAARAACFTLSKP